MIRGSPERDSPDRGTLQEDRWERLGELFDRALERPPNERPAWLDEACAGEPLLRHEVASMLEAHDRAEGILERSLSPLTPFRVGLAEMGLSGLDRPSGLGGLAVAGEEKEDGDRSGETVGPYRLVREIGRGGMGVVYQARDPRLDRFVALKFLPSSLAANREAHARFLAEAKAASALDHPSICTVFDLGETDDGQLYIAMAFYPGTTLSVRLEAGPLPVREAVKAARQVADGLARAHEAGIIHRDIKPSNLLITERGDAKILDFGVAKLEGGASLTLPGSLVGTITYMSPEQITGEELDPRSDLWSLGTVLYEMLAGRRPFQASSPAEALEAILGREPDSLRDIRPEVSPTLETVVARLLEKNPDDRYGTAAELARDLEAVEDGPTWCPPSAAVQARVAARGGAELSTWGSPVTPIVGRGEEVERARELLGGVRLLTLTGPAGTGKTRLALEVARRSLPDFPDGVHFVSLAEVAAPDLLPSTLAVGLGGGAFRSLSATEELKRSLERRRALLVLDNFEHLAAGAPFLAELLATCPRLKILVTSRVALRLSAEHELPVAPLPVPDPELVDAETATSESPAMALFVERARAARPDFRLTATNVRAVAEITARLDGLPLALELAAARIKLFSPQTLLARLGEGLDLLSRGALDLPDRHRTLREALDWSYRLLGPEEQRLFRRLSVFNGELPLQAVETVCGDLPLASIDGLSVLVDQSLLQRIGSEDGEARFSMLETVHDFALEKLAETDEEETVRRAHAHWYLEWTERAETELSGAESGAWLDRLEAAHSNLRSVLDWAAERGETRIGLRLGAALWRFWLVRGHLEEGCGRMQRLLRLPDSGGPSTLRARALHGLGTLTHNLGDNETAHTYLAGSAALYRYLGDRRGMAAVLNNLAWLACERSELTKARKLSEEALEIHRKLDDRKGMAVALSHLGWVANFEGDLREAQRLGRESLEARRTLGDQGGVVFALVNLAWAEQLRGDLDEAELLVGEALEVSEEIGDLPMRGFAHVLRARVLRDRGRSDEAAVQLERSLAAWRRSGNRSGVAWALGDLGHVLLDLGRLHDAERRLDEGLALWRAIGSRWGQALAVLGLARLARAEGRPGTAWRRLRDYLAAVVEMGVRRALPPGFELASGWLAESDPARSARLLALAERLRQKFEMPLAPRLRPVRDALELALRGALSDPGFAAAKTEGRVLAIAQAVAAIGH